MELLAAFAKAAWPLRIALLAHGLGCLAWLLSFWAPQFRDDRGRLVLAARALSAAGTLAALWAVAGIALETGRPPLKTFHEFLLAFAALLGLLALAADWRGRVRLLGVASGALALSALLGALRFMDMEPPALPPSLISGWFLPHALLYLAAYAVLSAVTALALLALRRPRGVVFEPGSFWERGFGSPELDFEALHLKALRLGFLLLLAGLATGALWAELAWGEAWSWDPKQTLALATLLGYGAILHLHHAEGWRGRRVLQASVLAWAFVLLAFFGLLGLPARAQSTHRYTDPPAPAEARPLRGLDPFVQ